MCLVVQEMLIHWPKIVAYISTTGPLQEFQHVVGRVSTWVLVPLFDAGLFVLLLTIYVKMLFRDKLLTLK